MRVVSFTPIKLNNERTPGKNTKNFTDGYPLIHYILSTLKQCNELNETYVYCSRDEIKDYLIPGVNYLKRDEIYDTAQANINDMFYSFSCKVDADIYVVAHATAPFLKSETIDKGIRAVKSGEYDSAVAVRKVQEFMWSANKPMNYNPEHIPRTQDLEPYYEETTGLYIFNREVIQKLHRRIGKKEFMIEVTPIESIDINNPVDFDIADAINYFDTHVRKIRGGYRLIAYYSASKIGEVA